MKGNTLIKLSCNENPLGASIHAIQAVQTALNEMHVYPDTNTPLKTLLSQLHSVDASQITLGNGSENILELILKAYLTQDDTAIISQYTFMTIPFLLKTAKANIITVPAKDYGHDLPAMQKAITDKTRFIFLVNPNNPTGTYFSHQALHGFLAKLPTTIKVILDEAYIDYADAPDFPDAIALLKKFPQLIIVRTFSKAYGLAGLRLGYCLSSPDIANTLKKYHLPFHVNRFALIAGCEALKDKKHLESSIALNHSGKQFLYHELAKRSLHYIPSFCNFVTLEINDATTLSQTMALQHVHVRPLADYHLPDHLRISIGTEDALRICLRTLDMALENQYNARSKS